MRIQGFEPVWNCRSRVLILGSFPSVKSREIGFYYGNAQNKFWKTIGEIFGEIAPSDIAAKKNFLNRHCIALWDVVDSCEIVGSMDKDIKNEVLSDVYGLLEKTDIELIICNGKKSYDLFSKNFTVSCEVRCLPSTSPANVRYDAAPWRDALGRFL